MHVLSKRKGISLCYNFVSLVNVRLLSDGLPSIRCNRCAFFIFSFLLLYLFFFFFSDLFISFVGDGIYFHLLFYFDFLLTLLG